jgi:hypothetical protein
MYHQTYQQNLRAKESGLDQEKTCLYDYELQFKEVMREKENEKS